MTSEPLGEIGDIVRGISFPKDAKSLEPRDGHVACLRTTNVQREVEWDDLWFVPTKHVKRREQFVQPGDILISTANSYELVGKVALVSALPRQATLGAFISLIRPRPGVDSKYLYHQLAWGRTQSRIRETASTTTNISNVSTKKLAALELDLPSLDEQRRIVAELEKQFSRLDKAVANLKRVKANLKRYKAAVLNAAVEGRLVLTDAKMAHERRVAFLSGADRLAAVLQRHREQWVGRGKYKEPAPVTEGFETAVPDGWVAATLSQLTLQIADVDHRMPSAVDRGTPYVSTKDFTDDDTIDFDGAKRISLEDYEALSRKVKPARGDVLLSRYGTVGEVRAVETDVPFQASYSVAIIKPVRGFELADYLKIALRSDALQAQIKRDVRATAQPDLGLGHIREFVVPLPPASEQRRIVAEVDRRLSIVREVEAEVDANLAWSLALRRSVLDRAFAPSRALEALP